jgi:hypothetical protein
MSTARSGGSLDQVFRFNRRVTMKTIAILAAIVAVTTATVANANTTPKIHEAGSAIKQGQFCWVATDTIGHGWWDGCDSHSQVPRGRSLQDRPATVTDAIGSGGGDGGHGGGGNR